MRTLYILLFFLFSMAQSFGQLPYFHHYEISKNFPRSAKIDLIYEDPLGPIWLGTTEGLFLFDGINFQKYIKTDTTSSYVTAIYRDHEEQLWVAYEDGSIYFLVHEKLEAWQPEEGTPSAEVNQIAEDDLGNIWFSTYGEGLYYWNGKRMYNISKEDGLAEDEIYVMVKDQRGRMWCGTDGGISICSVINNEKQIQNLTVADGLADEIVRELKIDGYRGVWVGMYDGGVAYYDFAQARFEQLIPNWNHGIVSSLEQFIDQELWIGTEDNGLLRYSFKNKKLETIPFDKNNLGKKIYDLHKDVEGNIWLTSNSNIINRANRQFEILPTELKDIQCVFHSKDNRLWLGTKNGLYSMETNLDGTTFYKKWLNEESVNTLSLYEDSFENLWIGTFGEGIICLKPKTGQIKKLGEDEGLTNGSILSIAGKEDKIWLATLGGVIEYDFDEDIFLTETILPYNYNQETGLGTNFIYKVFLCSTGRIWFGTDGKGLSVLDKNILKNYPNAYIETPTGIDTIPLEAIYSISQDSFGHIWFSTVDNGIFSFDGKTKFQHYGLEEGLRDLSISNIISTKNGNLLLTHPSGIDLFNPQTGHFIYFDESIGIKDFDPHINAVSTDREGNLWIADQTNLVKFTNLKEELAINPRILIQQVAISLDPIDLKSDMVFSHLHNNLLVKYIGLWYTNPAAVRYRYRLNGYDENWKFTSDRSVSYSQIDPGNYKFEISNIESDDSQHEALVQFDFKINPPIWSTWWFISLSAILVMGLIFLWQNWRVKRVQQVTELEKDKIFSQLETLKSQINPHFLFNSFNTLVGVIEENPKLAVEYVEQLSDFYRAILQYRNQELISLTEELALLKNYEYLLQMRFGKSLKFDIQLVSNAYYIAPLSLQLLVENAIKHNVIAATKPLTIHIYQNEDYISVENNVQPKVEKEASTNFGLESLRKRYHALSNLPLQIFSDDKIFKVNIPIIKSA